MRCTSPRTVGFKPDGKTISWSARHSSKEYAQFQLPCGKCLACRLDYARQWAVRCVHEAQMHEKNAFITLTYDDKHVGDGRLHYDHFQKFMKKLRKLQNEPIGVFVTGEYGDKTKRPHWHAILFNYQPRDAEHARKTEQGDQVFTSATLEKTWGFGRTEFGSVTFKSAGYCARYAAKKLGHGLDGQHDYEPISKKSSKYAIGKTWLEKFWPDVFSHGHIVLENGKTCSIPRYYEKWFKETHPDLWLRYVTITKVPKTEFARKRAEKEKQLWVQDMYERRDRDLLAVHPITRNQSRALIQESKFKMLQDYLKL